MVPVVQVGHDGTSICENGQYEVDHGALALPLDKAGEGGAVDGTSGAGGA